MVLDVEFMKSLTFQFAFENILFQGYKWLSITFRVQFRVKFDIDSCETPPPPRWLELISLIFFKWNTKPEQKHETTAKKSPYLERLQLLRQRQQPCSWRCHRWVGVGQVHREGAGCTWCLRRSAFFCRLTGGGPELLPPYHSCQTWWEWRE